MNAPTQPGSAGPAPAAQPNAEWLVEKYRQLRDKKKLLEDEQAKALKPFKDAMSQIENMLLDDLNRSGANSIQTNSGTAYRSTRTSYGVEDPAVFRAWVEANNTPEMYENRVSKDAIEAYVQKYNQLPPGIKVSSVENVNIRK